jgi:hypothetical protein
VTPALRRFAAALLLAATSLAVTPAACADGDPASDVLISAQIFFSYTTLPESSKATLTRVVRDANRAGYTARVALIGARFDLGAVPSLWRRPQPYATFLSQELLGPAPYTNRVLVVMPNGFGLSRNGKELPAERRALDAVPSAQAHGDDIAAAGVRAVKQLATLHGVKVDATAPGEGGVNRDLLVIAAAALTVVALGALVAVLRRRRA